MSTEPASATRYANPVVRGMAPDPSICRVGEDYYLATTTMDAWPGITIRHSTDLAHWTCLGGAVTRPAQYRRDGERGPIMLFASTLRHHEGRFYLVCTNVAEEQGNFIISTDDPAGEWSDAVWVDRDAFDPSLLFDGGRCYYTRRTLDPLPDGRLGPVVQAEINPDTGELLGPMRELTSDYRGLCSNDIEGPHLYRIGDRYYLFSAEGGSWKGHMQTCARSDSPWGPFEPCPHNPVLTHRDRVGHPIQDVGHAELVEAADGSWWAACLGTRHDGFTFHHNLGRETFLAPVEWTEDGWPAIGREGGIELEMGVDRPLPSAATAFSGPARRTLWSDGWMTMGQPDDRLEVTTGPEVIELPYSGGLGIEETAAPIGALLRRQQEDHAVFSAVLDAAPQAPNEAGVAAYSDAHHHYALVVGLDEAGDRRVTLRRTVDDMTVAEHTVLHGSGPTRLTITAHSDRTDRYEFAAADAGPGQERAPVDCGSGRARLISAEAAEGFVGTHFALVAVGDHAAPASFREVLERY